MTDYYWIDFFTDQSLVPDPHPYFDYLRSQNPLPVYDSTAFSPAQSLVPNPPPYFDSLRSQTPVLRLPHYGVVAITGYEEATEVYKDPETFSNIVALGGPFPPLPFQPDGDDISPLIDQHRGSFPMNEHMV